VTGFANVKKMFEKKHFAWIFPTLKIKKTYMNETRERKVYREEEGYYQVFSICCLISYQHLSAIDNVNI